MDSTGLLCPALANPPCTGKDVGHDCGTKAGAVSRRSSATWAATSMPDMRRHWCEALETSIGRQAGELALPPDLTDVPGAKRLQRLSEKLGESMTLMSNEIDAIRRAELFWVSRDMSEVVAGAAGSLPAWTPSLAAPALNGVLCWAKPIGTAPWMSPGESTPREVDCAGLWWWTRPSDNVLQIQPIIRMDRHPELLEPYGVRSPLWAATKTLMVNPSVPRTHEETSRTDASEFVSLLGAAWLLMAQRNVATTRTIGDDKAPRPDGVEADPPTPAPTRAPSGVTIVDINRDDSGRRTGGSERKYRSRFWVDGHWRQQPCGPEHSQRKPVWINQYVKGPRDAPLTPKQKVYVLRR